MPEEETRGEKQIPKIKDIKKEFPVKCENCVYWETYHQNPSSGTGECRKQTPGSTHEMLGPRPAWRAKWPITFHHEWCGEGRFRNP